MSKLQVQKWFWEHGNHKHKYNNQGPRDNEGKIYCEIDKEIDALAQNLNLDINNQAVSLITDEDVIEQVAKRGLNRNLMKPKE